MLRWGDFQVCGGERSVENLRVPRLDLNAVKSGV